MLAKASIANDNYRLGFDISLPLFHRSHPEKGKRPQRVPFQNLLNACHNHSKVNSLTAILTRSTVPVLWIRKYFFRIRILDPRIRNLELRVQVRIHELNTSGFGSRRPIISGSGPFMDIFVANGKNILKNMSYVSRKPLKMIKC